MFDIIEEAFNNCNLSKVLFTSLDLLIDRILHFYEFVELGQHIFVIFFVLVGRAETVLHQMGVLVGHSTQLVIQIGNFSCESTCCIIQVVIIDQNVE